MLQGIFKVMHLTQTSHFHGLFNFPFYNEGTTSIYCLYRGIFLHSPLACSCARIYLFRSHCDVTALACRTRHGARPSHARYRARALLAVSGRRCYRLFRLFVIVILYSFSRRNNLIMTLSHGLQLHYTMR